MQRREWQVEHLHSIRWCATYSFISTHLSLRFMQVTFFFSSSESATLHEPNQIHTLTTTVTSSALRMSCVFAKKADGKKIKAQPSVWDCFYPIRQQFENGYVISVAKWMMPFKPALVTEVEFAFFWLTDNVRWFKFTALHSWAWNTPSWRIDTAY